MTIRKIIQSRLDDLAKLLETQSHIHAPELVTEKLESVSKFWSILSEEEREFIASVRFALKEGLEWETGIAKN